MSIQRKILFSSLVKPFYRQHAALLCFFFYMMTLAVGRANGVGLLEYHYSLIRGMLTNPPFLLMVLAAWLLYAIKCSQFIALSLRKPAFSYLYLLSLENGKKVYWLLLQVQLVLFLPVFSYLIFILKVGYREHWNIQSNGILLFIISVCTISAWRHFYLLRNPAAPHFSVRWKFPVLLKMHYINFLFRSILEKSKVLFLMIKGYNCITLYLMLDGRNPVRDHDLRMEALFFSMGILGHGVLTHRLKEMENEQLAFYRGLPVSLSRRFSQYAWFYFCLFIPELIIILSRTPSALSYSESAFLIILGYGILMLLNSLQLYNYTGLKDYLKTLVQIFFAVIIAMIVRQLFALSFLFLLLSVIIFFRRYYRFEPMQNNALQGAGN